jgi:hypothetical protein
MTNANTQHWSKTMTSQEKKFEIQMNAHGKVCGNEMGREGKALLKWAKQNEYKIENHGYGNFRVTKS